MRAPRNANLEYMCRKYERDGAKHLRCYGQIEDASGVVDNILML